ncbi:MAG: hypothetical protein GYA62_03995 [Bacteroidales bacterium]|jgi:hypothetical protein|nr:hypothetical protein [Bacteroidales bacterium]
MKIFILLLFGLILQSCVHLKIENKKTTTGEKEKSFHLNFYVPLISRHYTHIKLKDKDRHLLLKTRSYIIPCKCSPVPGHEIKKSYNNGVQSLKDKVLVDKNLFIKRSKNKIYNCINNRKVLKEKIKLKTTGDISIKRTKVYENKRKLFLRTMQIDTIPKKKAKGVVFL